MKARCIPGDCKTTEIKASCSLTHKMSALDSSSLSLSFVTVASLAVVYAVLATLISYVVIHAAISCYHANVLCSDLHLSSVGLLFVTVSDVYTCSDRIPSCYLT